MAQTNVMVGLLPFAVVPLNHTPACILRQYKNCINLSDKYHHIEPRGASLENEWKSLVG
jgi:hypothetical protein